MLNFCTRVAEALEGHIYREIKLKQFTYIFLFFSTSLLYSQKPNKTIRDTVFEVGDVIQLPTIFYNLSHPSPFPSDSLNKVALFVNEHGNKIFQLQSHTDQRGTTEKNLILSMARLKSVFEYLKPLLKDTAQLTAKGFGESQPIISQKEIDKIKDKAKQEELYSINRRTILVVTGKK